MKYLITLLLPFFAGCLATTDLAKDPVLPRDHQILLSHVADLATTRCIRVNLDPVTGKKISDGTRFTQRMSIRRYFISNTDWIRVEANSQGAWDNIYFNTSNNRLICGQNEWDSFSDTRAIIFTEYGTERKLLGQTPISQPRSNQPPTNLLNNQPNNSAIKKYEEWNKTDWERIKQEDSLINLSTNSVSELCKLYDNQTVNQSVIRRELIRRGENGLHCDNLNKGSRSSSSPRSPAYNKDEICRDYAILLKINLDKIQNPKNQPIISNEMLDSVSRVLQFIETIGDERASKVFSDC